MWIRFFNSDKQLPDAHSPTTSDHAALAREIRRMPSVTVQNIANDWRSCEKDLSDTANNSADDGYRVIHLQF